MLETMLQTLQNTSGPVALGAVVFVLLLCGFGLPLPEEVPLFIAGYLVFTGEVSLWNAVLYTTLSILIGDSVIYFAGYRYGHQIFQSKFASRFLTPRRLKKVNDSFHQYGSRVVFIARFMAGLRMPVFLMAGVLRMSYRRFIFFDGIAAIISAPLIVWVTYRFCVHFGGETDKALTVVRQTERWLLAGVVLVILIVSLVLLRLQKKRTSGEAKDSTTEKIKS